MSNKTILVTGGLGFIGSHTICLLCEQGYQVVIIDDLSNSQITTLDTINTLWQSDLPFYQGDYADHALLTQVFSEHSIDAVIHFAGSKYVGESVSNPLLYYQNNVAKTVTFLQFLQQHQINHFIFSSTATVYGASQNLPLNEDEPICPLPPYGQSKAMIEQILIDLAAANADFKFITLRYFNPIGAHPSGKLGEEYGNLANNLMPIIMQVLEGKRSHVSVFGDDYDTVDGTGVRDYIHVMDLAKGHVVALDALLTGKNQSHVYNLGTGKGSSVLELINTFTTVNQVAVPYQITTRRAGDVPVSYADVSRIKSELGWQTELELESMCRDVYHYINR